MIGPRLSRTAASGLAASSQGGGAQANGAGAAEAAQGSPGAADGGAGDGGGGSAGAGGGCGGAEQHSEADDGLLPRCLAAAFAGIEARRPGAEFAPTASCLELYNECVTDLLGSDRARQCTVGGG